MLRVRRKESETAFEYKGLSRREAIKEGIPFHLRVFRYEGGEGFPTSTQRREVPIDSWIFEWVEGDKVEVLPTPSTYPR